MIDVWVDVMSDVSCLASLCAFQRHRQHGLSLGHDEELAVFVRQLSVHHVDDVVSHGQPLVMQGFHGPSATARILQRQFAQQLVFLISHQTGLHDVAIHHGQTGDRGLVVGAGGRGRVGGAIQLVKPPVDVTREVDDGFPRRTPFFHSDEGVGRQTALHGPSHSVLGSSSLVSADPLDEGVSSQSVDAGVCFSHQFKVLGHGQVQSEFAGGMIAIRGPHPRRLSDRVHVHRHHLVVVRFGPVTVTSSVSNHLKRLGMFQRRGYARPEFHAGQIVGIVAAKHDSHGHCFLGQV